MFITKTMLLVVLLYSLISFCLARDENVLMTEVFEITIDPPMFNWTYEGRPDQYVYQASLLNAPDLPHWINYIYSRSHHAGFLYGVPPNENHAKVPLEIVALNRKNYETRLERLNVHISEKRNPAKYEVHMKIDNVNVEDMFNVETMEKLKDVYRKHLWKNSENDIYVTFLASAIELGARKPLNPDEREGVVIHLGSIAPFSTELIELQEEVRPLWRKPSCPRDYKRTSVERHFRNANFALDWCVFRLIDNNKSALHHSGKNEKLLNTVERHFEDIWDHVSRYDLPERSYRHELIFSLVLPMCLLVFFSVLLSLILCFHHEGIRTASDDFFDNLFHICTDFYYSSRNMEDPSKTDLSQYTTIQRATQSLRSLSNNRDITISPDPMLLPKSHTNSPTSTISKGIHCRPSPPPYVRPKYKADF